LRSSSAITAKAQAGFARACYLNRRVERQDVGLEGDLVNHLDDFREIRPL
jgi:hypothetical protein